MANYVKLFGSILDSTIWKTPPAITKVWVTMMAMADRDGVVEASVPGLVDRARVTRRYVEKALGMFMAPDPDSRTELYEGRRIEKVTGGWRLLNYEYYRALQDAEDRRDKAAARQQRRRDRLKEKAIVTPIVTQSHASHAIRAGSDLGSGSSNSLPIRGSAPEKSKGDASSAPWPGLPDPEPEVWSAHVWHRNFGMAWSESYNTMALPGGGAASVKATEDLAGMLAGFNRSSAMAAQARAASMFAEYLGDQSPIVVKNRHPWPWFVTRFQGLLAPQKSACAAPRGVEVGHTDQVILQRSAGPVKL
jgi:hypothetical protein